MVIDPREGNGNAQTRGARTLLPPFPRVNSYVVMETENLISFIKSKLLRQISKIFMAINRAISKVILPG